MLDIQLAHMTVQMVRTDNFPTSSEWRVLGPPIPAGAQFNLLRMRMGFEKDCVHYTVFPSIHCSVLLLATWNLVPACIAHKVPELFAKGSHVELPVPLFGPRFSGVLFSSQVWHVEYGRFRGERV